MPLNDRVPKYIVDDLKRHFATMCVCCMNSASTKDYNSARLARKELSRILEFLNTKENEKMV